MEVTVEEAGKEKAEVVWRLLQLYLYEMSDHDGRAIGADGWYPYPYFDLYWEEESRVPLLIRADGDLAGFAFVRELEPGVREIAEFLVLRAWRRRGVGKAAAGLVLDSWPGKWEIRFHSGNAAGAALWRGLAARRQGVSLSVYRSLRPCQA